MIINVNIRLQKNEKTHYFLLKKEHASAAYSLIVHIIKSSVTNNILFPVS